MKIKTLKQNILFFLFLCVLSFPIDTSAQEPVDMNKLLRFAVIGDYGYSSSAEKEVANLVKSWNPDFIVTTGDNNYEDGSKETIDENIGRYYSQFIGSYMGMFGSGVVENKFFPSLGNHDYGGGTIKPYLKYFSLPSNERYYDFIKGPVHFFAINSNKEERSGVTENSKQAKWLKEKLLKSDLPFKIVYFHHPPYSSSDSGSAPIMRWPFKDWGVDIVFSGHNHNYERLNIDGITYIVVGNSGKSIDEFSSHIRGSRARYSKNFGALLATVQGDTLTLEYYSITGGNKLTDSITIQSKKTVPSSLPSEIVLSQKSYLKNLIGDINTSQLELRNKHKSIVYTTKNIGRALANISFILDAPVKDNCANEVNLNLEKLNSYILKVESKDCTKTKNKKRCIPTSELTNYVQVFKDRLAKIQEIINVDLRNENTAVDVCK